MEMTLHEALNEIDKWKTAAVDQIANVSPAQRGKIGQEAVAWLEREIGRSLETVPVAQRDSTVGS